MTFWPNILFLYKFKVATKLKWIKILYAILGPETLWYKTFLYIDIHWSSTISSANHKPSLCCAYHELTWLLLEGEGSTTKFWLCMATKKKLVWWFVFLYKLGPGHCHLDLHNWSVAATQSPIGHLFPYKPAVGISLCQICTEGYDEG